MTDDELTAIEARANKATVGPWTMRWKSLSLHQPSDDPRYTYGDQVTRFADEDPDNTREEDYEFLIHARQDIPALLAEVRRLKKLAGRRSESRQELLDRLDKGIQDSPKVRFESFTDSYDP